MSVHVLCVAGGSVVYHTWRLAGWDGARTWEGEDEIRPSARRERGRDVMEAEWVAAGRDVMGVEWDAMGGGKGGVMVAE